MHEGAGRSKTSRAAHGGQKDTLGQQLANQADTTGANRDANRDFFSPRDSTGQKKVSDIAAGDEQNTASSPGEEQHRLSIATHDRVQIRGDQSSEFFAGHHVRPFASQP